MGGGSTVLLVGTAVPGVRVADVERVTCVWGKREFVTVVEPVSGLDEASGSKSSISASFSGEGRTRAAKKSSPELRTRRGA